MEIKILKSDGKESGRKIKLVENIFNIQPNDHAIYLDIKHHLANQRQGTSKTKERAEVTGSTKKIKRQKGTGTARAGTIKSPIFKGGGRAFGPRPHDYGFKLNKKIKALAKKSALSYKAKNDSIRILEDFSLDNPKTREFYQILKNLSADHQKTLLVIPENNKNIALSSRNIKNSKVVMVNNLNTYEVLHADKILFFEGSMSKIEEILN